MLSIASASTGFRRLSATEWIPRRSAYGARVAPIVAGRRERTGRGERHPVWDFLFEYYPYRPGQLEKWHPGFGVILDGLESQAYLSYRGYELLDGGIAAQAIRAERRQFIQWLQSFLSAIDQRPPAYGCSGLHEWAMVYRTSTIRHPDQPLRLTEAEIATVVESLPIRCTHYDAFRFFTPAARPLNRAELSRESSILNEQSGCLHANMDLYKWAFKLSPQTPSDLVLDAFELACRIREVDMRASPYDLSNLGFAPIHIECAEGREEYAAYQRQFTAEAQPIRRRLIHLCDNLLNAPCRSDQSA